MIPALLLALLALHAAGVQAAQVLIPPDTTFQPLPGGGQWVEAEHAAFASGTPLPSAGTAHSHDDCAALCAANPKCAWFEWCPGGEDPDGGCRHGEPHLAYHECLPYANSPCTLAPLVARSGPDVQRSAGFPIRSTHPEHPGFVGQAAQGLNATPEHPVLCPQSLLPGGCAVGSLDEAFSVCLGTPNCRSIVQYWNGTSGCGGPPLAVLVTTPLSRATGWVAPSVDTFIRYDLNFTGSGQGGLSGGAIAGIAVGATAAAFAAVLAGAAWLHRRRSRRRALRAGGGTDVESEPGSHAKLSQADSLKAAAAGGLPPWARPALRSSAALLTAAVGEPSLPPPSSPAGTAGSPAVTPRAGSQASQTSAPGSPRSIRIGGAVRRSPFAGGPRHLRTAFASASAPQVGSPHQASPGGTPATTSSPGNSSRQPSAFLQPQPSTSSEAGLPPLAELVQHVAECEALASYSPLSSQASSGSGSAGLPPHDRPLLSPRALSPNLREWLVDVSEVTFLRWPNGALQELGSGASATVFKVLFRGETCACKELDVGRSPAVQAAFVAECERLHQLRHAHIVSLYALALSGSRGLIITEYCAGRDLHGVLQLRAAGSEERLFSWYRRGRRVALDCAKALNFLHAKGVVHLDIKSSNVLLTGTGTAKLADVGLARLLQGTHLSQLPPCGTFAWVAPEVLLGEPCTTAIDIFSLGVLLWEIITGEQPQRGRMRLPHVPQECPQEVADLMVACMQLDPSSRPTAQRVMQQLVELQGGGG